MVWSLILILDGVKRTKGCKKALREKWNLFSTDKTFIIKCFPDFNKIVIIISLPPRVPKYYGPMTKKNKLKS